MWNTIKIFYSSPIKKFIKRMATITTSASASTSASLYQFIRKLLTQRSHISFLCAATPLSTRSKLTNATRRSCRNARQCLKCLCHYLRSFMSCECALWVASWKLCPQPTARRDGGTDRQRGGVKEGVRERQSRSWNEKAQQKLWTTFSEIKLLVICSKNSSKKL